MLKQMSFEISYSHVGLKENRIHIFIACLKFPWTFFLENSSCLPPKRGSHFEGSVLRYMGFSTTSVDMSAFLECTQILRAIHVFEHIFLCVTTTQFMNMPKICLSITLLMNIGWIPVCSSHKSFHTLPE